MSQPQAGMAQEGEGERGLAPDATAARVHGVPQGLFIATVLAVFFPALVYALLAGLWMLRALSELTGFARR